MYVNETFTTRTFGEFYVTAKIATARAAEHGEGEGHGKRT
jgi:hypothetical protein